MHPLKKIFSFRIYLLSLIEAVQVALCYLAPILFFDSTSAEVYLQYEGGTTRLTVIAATYLVASYLFDFSRQLSGSSSVLLPAIQTSQLIGVILLVHAGLDVLDPNLVLPQHVMLTGSILALLVITVWRVFLRPRVWAAFGAQKMLLVGYSKALAVLAKTFRQDATFGIDVVGCVQVLDAAAVCDPVLGSLRELRKIIATVQPDRIVIGSEIHDAEPLKTLLDAKAAGISVLRASDAYELAFGRVDAAGLEPYSVIYRDELSSRPTAVALQSVYNNVLGLVVILLALPLLVTIAVVLLFSGRRPVFTRTRCAGLYGIPFHLYRFNTSGRIGSFLERRRVDALPQVLNIIRGEVALIGPRAERVEFDHILSDLIPFYKQRQHVKPGLMGWSQLHCDPMPEENTTARIEYDFYYIKHISLAVDAYVMLRAVKMLFSGPKQTNWMPDVPKAVTGAS